MSKKKKKSKTKYDDYGFVKLDSSIDNKGLEKKFNKLIKEIEIDRINIYEADKKDHKKMKHKKKINKEEAEFLSSMKGIKKRKKIIKKWKKKGLFKKVVDILKEGGKAVRILGKMIASFILLILNIEGIRDKISTKTLNRLTMLFQIAVGI